MYDDSDISLFFIPELRRRHTCSVPELSHKMGCILIAAGRSDFIHTQVGRSEKLFRHADASGDEVIDETDAEILLI